MVPKQATLTFLMAATMLAAGCFGGSSGYTPNGEVKETGKTVHLRMWIEDRVNVEIYPGLGANLWAFCAEPANPSDQYSADAIEYLRAGDKCSVPGPTIRVKQGDRVLVNFLNEHAHPHTIHWHGQYVPNLMDGGPGVTQDSVLPSQSFDYDFVAKRAGTLWYHCHVDTQFHVMQGLYGVFIVEPQDTSREPTDIDREYVLVFSTATRQHVEFDPDNTDPHAKHKHSSQCGVTGNPGCQNPPVDVTPDVFMINGQSFPNTMEDPNSLITIAQGERIRIRMVNVGETWEAIHIHGHDFFVTHRDGVPYHPDARFWADTLSIGPAERYDVVVEGDNPGLWMFHTHVNSHEVNDRQAPGGMHTMVLYEGFEDQMHQYAGELPGGQPFRRPLPKMPEDFFDTHREVVAGGATALSATWDFPITMACGVRQVRFMVEAEATTRALQGQNDLTVSIMSPEGRTFMTFDLGAQEFAQQVKDNTTGRLFFANGDYDVQLSGPGTETSVRFDVMVDYWRSHQDGQLACDPRADYHGDGTYEIHY